MFADRLLYAEDNGVIKMIETYYRILKHNPEGKLVKDSGLIPSHSYVIQFLELLEGIMRDVTKDATDVNNAEGRLLTTTGVSITQFGRMDAGAGVDAYGIVVGTNAGATAEANDNYNLDTKILHSATGEAGKLNYQAVTFIAPTPAAGNIDFDTSRAFLNETGSTITVKEIGMICKNIQNTRYHLLLRDVVTDEAVLDGYTLTVVYTLRTTV